jgi:zinc protease
MNPIWLALACAHTPETPVTDLTVPPAITAAPDYVPPVPTEHKLSNGMPVWLIEKPGLPIVSLRMVIPGGSASDQEGAWGSTSLADELLNHGAGDRDATTFAAEVERLALSLGTSTGGSSSTVYLDAHTDHLSAGLALMADLLLRPTFATEDVDRAKTLRVGALTEASDDPRTLAGWVMDKKYFGEAHPFGHPTEGTISAIQALTTADLKASWAARYIPDHASIVVSGAVDAATLLPMLETSLAGWAATGTPRPQVPPPPVHTGDDRYFFVNKEGTSQTALQVMMPAPTGSDPASEPAGLGAIVLGGTFTSRLNRLLREEKGYTYGARATYSGKPNYGYLLARTNVQRDVSAEALIDLLAEIQRYQDGIDAVELKKAQGAWQTRAVSSMESRSAIASNFAALAIHDLPMSTLRDELDRAQATTVEMVNQAITESQLDHAIFVVVGDLAKIQDDITTAVPAQWAVVSATEEE